MAVSTTEGSGSERETAHLQVLLADERTASLERTAGLLRDLGHDVIARAVSLDRVAEQVASEQPDLAGVVVYAEDDHALELIEQVTRLAGRPLIVLAEGPAPAFVAEAAERGIFACADPSDAADLQGAIEVTMRRFQEAERLSEQVVRLETALERRSLIERAKGILMERHDVDDAAAFGLLRDQARRRSRTVVELAHAVVEGHALLPKRED